MGWNVCISAQDEALVFCIGNAVNFTDTGWDMLDVVCQRYNMFFRLIQSKKSNIIISITGKTDVFLNE